MIDLVEQHAQQPHSELLGVELFQAASRKEFRIQGGVRQGEGLPALHALVSDINLTARRAAECFVRLRKWRFLHRYVPVAKTPADVSSFQLDHNDPRGYIEDLVVGLATPGGDLGPVLPDHQAKLLCPVTIAKRVRQDYDRHRAILEASDPIAPPTCPLAPTDPAGASAQVGLNARG